MEQCVGRLYDDSGTVARVGFGTRGAAVESLLADGVLVDLYRIVREGLVVGSPSYSLKKLEPLYMAPRAGPVTDARASIEHYERWRRTGGRGLLADLAAYNRTDVESTWRLRTWLAGLAGADAVSPRPPPGA